MLFFFFNDTATTEIYTLSLHDALPIWPCSRRSRWRGAARREATGRHGGGGRAGGDRKSTRLNSSHLVISYAVFCLKKKKKKSLLLPHGTMRKSGDIRVRLRTEASCWP